jgi:mono/diheme cytochrome c family protein
VRGWKKAAVYGLLGLVVSLVLGVSVTIGWRPFIGPRARPLTGRTFEPTAARLERGAYVVNAVAGCTYCHSDFDASERPLRTRAGAEGGGHIWAPEGMPWLVAPNLTPDKDTGTGNWSDDTIARAAREGIGHDGRALFPLMPYGNYRNMSDEDLASVVVYLRTLKPIHRDLPRSALPFPLNRLINSAPAPITDPIPSPDLSDHATRGRYLVTLASCADCHSPMDDHGQPIPGMAFGGGNTLKYEGRPSAASANLTPSPNGIPYYTEALFLETIRTGRVREREVSDLMPWAGYRNMTDEDLKAIFAYLKTLSPVDHFVDNALPPTQCARCSLEHGGGERNKKAS